MEQKTDRLITDDDFAAFEEAERLNRQSDPETEPFKSKYAARKMLLNLAESLKTLYEQDPNQSTVRILYGHVLYLIGLNFVETEERGHGEPKVFCEGFVLTVIFGQTPKLYDYVVFF